MSEKPTEKPGADWFMAEAEKARAGNFELVPGMRELGKGINKVYVESDYAPLKSVYLANASAFHIPDMDVAWDMANMFAHNSEQSRAYMRKHAGTFLGDSDPERYEKVVAESNALAKAYRDNGVYVIRNDSGVVPEEQITFSESWSKQKLVGTYAQAAWEVVGSCLINFWEVSAVALHAVSCAHQLARPWSAHERGRHQDLQWQKGRLGHRCRGALSHDRSHQSKVIW